MAGKYARYGYKARNKKVDANQKEIVDALAAIPGVTVVDIGKPLDLLVGFQGVTHLFEIKNPEGKNKLEPDQEQFIKDWTGRAPVIVRSVNDALLALGVNTGLRGSLLRVPRA